MSRGPSNRRNAGHGQRQAESQPTPAIGGGATDWGNRRDQPPTNEYDNRPDKRWWHIREPLPFIVNVLTLIAVGLYTAYAANQVGATQDANKIAKQSLVQTNRPYVMWTSFTPVKIKDNSGEHLHISPVFTNWGNTPAEGVTFYNCDPLIRDNLSAPALNCNVSEREHPATSIGPKQPVSFVGPALSQDDLEATRSEKKVIYIYGYIYYKDYVDLDQYGQPSERLTEYCQRIMQATSSPLAPPVPSEALPIVGLGCPDFSCSDQACRYRPPH